MTKKTALYSNCILVKGASRSVICDLQLQQMHYIPNSLYGLLENHLGKTVEDIKKAYNNKYDDIIDSYFQFLEEKDCVFFTEHPERFPKLNMDWDFPHKISNAIVDYHSKSSYDIINVLNQLDELKCKSIQIRFFSKIEEEKLTSILSYLKEKESIIASVEVYLEVSEWTNKDRLIDIISSYPRVNQCVVHSSTFEDIIDLGNKYLIYTKQKVNSELHCGIISPKYFSINLKTFTESKNYNSCLNRKVSVDKEGLIKNCPSMTNDYGSIKNTTLKKVVESEKFRQIWSIKKDQISICKDCEFRYVCTDCRAYIEDSKDNFSKPIKCGYNPYTNKWEKWSESQLKKVAIENYGLTEII